MKLLETVYAEADARPGPPGPRPRSQPKKIVEYSPVWPSPLSGCPLSRLSRAATVRPALAASESEQREAAAPQLCRTAAGGRRQPQLPSSRPPPGAAVLPPPGAALCAVRPPPQAPARRSPARARRPSPDVRRPDARRRDAPVPRRREVSIFFHSDVRRPCLLLVQIRIVLYRRQTDANNFVLYGFNIAG